MKSSTLLIAFALVFLNVSLMAQVTFPDPLNPTSPTSLMEWWVFIYSLATPLGVWLFGKFSPSSTKKELIIKASSIAILILVVILFFKGFSLATLGQALIAFVLQAITYDKVLNPLGMDTQKTTRYTKE